MRTSIGASPARRSDHSDLAFFSKYAIQGNYNGFEVFDISNPAKPVIVQTYVCPASQDDVSVYKNLLFMSSESTNSRTDCGFGGVPEPISKGRVRGIRVFDIADVKNPKLVTSVQTMPRIAHAHRRDAAGRQRQRVSMCRATRVSDRPKSCPGARTAGSTIRTRRGSVWK